MRRVARALHKQRFSLFELVWVPFGVVLLEDEGLGPFVVYMIVGTFLSWGLDQIASEDEPRD